MSPYGHGVATSALYCLWIVTHGKAVARRLPRRSLHYSVGIERMTDAADLELLASYEAVLDAADRSMTIARALAEAHRAKTVQTSGIHEGVIAGIVEPDDLAAAIATVTSDALEEVYWIEQALPADILNAPARPDEQRCEIAGDVDDDAVVEGGAS